MGSGLDQGSRNTSRLTSLLTGQVTGVEHGLDKCNVRMKGDTGTKSFTGLTGKCGNRKTNHNWDRMKSGTRKGHTSLGMAYWLVMSPESSKKVPELTWL